MVEPKISLSLLVPGANRLSSQECDENSKENYNEHRVLISYTKGKGKHQKQVKKTLVIQTRKQKLVTQSINICEEAYRYMLNTPASPKLAKIWKSLPIRKRLNHHFDLIANDLHAVSYSYEVLAD